MKLSTLTFTAGNREKAEKQISDWYRSVPGDQRADIILTVRPDVYQQGAKLFFMRKFYLQVSDTENEVEVMQIIRDIKEDTEEYWYSEKGRDKYRYLHDDGTQKTMDEFEAGCLSFNTAYLYASSIMNNLYEKLFVNDSIIKN